MPMLISDATRNKKHQVCSLQQRRHLEAIVSHSKVIVLQTQFLSNLQIFRPTNIPGAFSLNHPPKALQTIDL
ncbi:hypothetical protein HK096_000561, partial [Nowakowskiella sp. JEL0078]